ncbi:hypothetical protein V8G54_036689 [Vigna mungo]|uniref:Uncharacterized protein n=1 Tax=Vigna mungo TaxID=3915 RepID=A0AAQ3MHV3_VIGMU
MKKIRIRVFQAREDEEDEVVFGSTHMKKNKGSCIRFPFPQEAYLILKVCIWFLALWSPQWTVYLVPEWVYLVPLEEFALKLCRYGTILFDKGEGCKVGAVRISQKARALHPAEVLVLAVRILKVEEVMKKLELGLNLKALGLEGKEKGWEMMMAELGSRDDGARTMMELGEAREGGERLFSLRAEIVLKGVHVLFTVVFLSEVRSTLRGDISGKFKGRKRKKERKKGGKGEELKIDSEASSFYSSMNSEMFSNRRPFCTCFQPKSDRSSLSHVFLVELCALEQVTRAMKFFFLSRLPLTKTLCSNKAQPMPVIHGPVQHSSLQCISLSTTLAQLGWPKSFLQQLQPLRMQIKTLDFLTMLAQFTPAQITRGCSAKREN